MSETATRRAALCALAGLSALAIPTVAIAAAVPPGADAELVALAAEIERDLTPFSHPAITRVRG